MSALSGSTSIVHVLLVSSLAKLIEPLWALWAVGFLGATAYGLGLVRLAFLAGASWSEAALLMLVGISVGEMPHQLMNGLETGWALAALTWMLGAAQATGTKRWELPVACGLAPFVRPELLVIAGMLLAARCWCEFRFGGARPTQRVVVVFVLAAAPWLIVCLAGFGAPFPNTIQAKTYFFAEACWPLARRLELAFAGLRHFGDTLGYIVLAGPFLLRAAVGRIGLAFAATFIGAYTLRLPGAVWHYEQRYLYVLVPLLLWALCSAVGSGSRDLRLAATGLSVIALIQGALHWHERWAAHLARRAFTTNELGAVVGWLNTHAPHAQVMVHDIGYLSFVGSPQILDAVGLKQRSSMVAHRERTFVGCDNRARGDALHRIASDAKPQFAVFLGDWDRLFGLAEGLRRHGWTLVPRYPGAAYTIFALTPPGS